MKVTVLLSLVFVIGGCNLQTDDPTILINDRINNFQSSLNAGAYSDLQKHFHPDMVSYESYLNTDIFETGSPLNKDNSPFYFGPATVSDIDGSDNKLAAGTFGNKYIPDNDEAYSAVMKLDGDSWKILQMTITVANKSYLIKTLK